MPSGLPTVQTEHQVLKFRAWTSGQIPSSRELRSLLFGILPQTTPYICCLTGKRRFSPQAKAASSSATLPQFRKYSAIC